TDIKYKKLLENQISSINKDRYLIMKKVERFYYQYKNNRLSESITKRCCNFAILEDKSEKYKEQMKEKI
ncbi:type III toxin-antitoxin system ToxN/AbiQ family toxin, partial [bacterium]|nr:type III toxin-antitoxin system ToxN/AbiQ family toxin [bacterium]